MHAAGMFLAKQVIDRRLDCEIQAAKVVETLISIAESYVSAGFMHGYTWEIMASRAWLGLPTNVFWARACSLFAVSYGNPLAFLLQQCAHGVGHGMQRLGLASSACVSEDVVKIFGNRSTYMFKMWSNWCSTGVTMATVQSNSPSFFVDGFFRGLYGADGDPGSRQS